MRSLYTQDIPGASPQIHYYNKSLIRHRHLEEVERFGNKEKRIMEWYKPLPRHQEPIDKEEFPTNTSLFLPQAPALKQQHSVLGSSRTVPKVTGKVTDTPKALTKSSILSQSGRTSLQNQEDLDDSPYFPHKYRDYDREYPNKWTGRREWEGGMTQSMKLPNVSG